MKLLCTLLLLCAALPCYSQRLLSDALGRRVMAPERPRRIICLAPSIADDVYALGAGANVIAVSDFTKYPQQARAKRSIGPPLQPSIETILALHPDLVLADASLNARAHLQPLERAHIAVYYIHPQGLQGIFRSLQNLGAALHREAQAQALVGHLRRRITAVQQRVSGLPQTKILMPVWYDPVITIGGDAYLTDLIASAGALSVTAHLAGEWPHISMEYLIARAPETLLLVKGSAMSMDAVRERPGWKNLPAIVNNRVIWIDDRLLSPSPVAIDALEELSYKLHP